MKLVVNARYGGFVLSNEALEKLQKLKGTERINLDDDKTRADKDLVSIVEELGSKASENLSDLRVVEIPNEATDYYIENYDGVETVHYVIDGKIKHLYI